MGLGRRRSRVEPSYGHGDGGFGELGFEDEEWPVNGAALVLDRFDVAGSLHSGLYELGLQLAGDYVGITFGDGQRFHGIDVSQNKSFLPFCASPGFSNHHWPHSFPPFNHLLLGIPLFRLGCMLVFQYKGTISSRKIASFEWRVSGCILHRVGNATILSTEFRSLITEAKTFALDVELRTFQASRSLYAPCNWRFRKNW